MISRILYLQSTISLGALAEACLSLTPKLSMPKEHELYLDIGPTQKLFGGEEATLFLAQSLTAPFPLPRLHRVLTDRPEWARVFARDRDTLLPSGSSQNALLKLPIDRLEECGDPVSIEKERGDRHSLVAFMRRVGVQRIADFVRLSTVAILRRFGKLGLTLQEWSMGKRECQLPLFLPREPIAETLDGSEIYSLDGLMFLLRHTLVRMESRLRGRNELVSRLTLALRLDSRETLSKTIELAHPMGDATSLLRLLQDYFYDQRWESPLEELRLEISGTVPNVKGQLSLFDDAEKRFSDLAEYVTRLRARFGNASVGFATVAPSFLPERSWALVWPPPEEKVPPPTLKQRPPFLFDPPRPIPAPRQYRLVPAEHLAAEWWEPGGFRRYFIAQGLQGETLWLFFDCQKQEWFAQGSFD